ncbi:MAG: redoxin domain-containing protein [Proteobacteria bacterium]|nr:redoxin domain-containing protein [Pseudomonadota bacterium]MDA1206316.1 redoxin domain-containing protein [Pseudomonadota bacterium]
MLDGYNALLSEFEALGARIIAATVDDREHVAAVAEGLSFPVCYGVDRDLGDTIGAWWEPRRDHIQPSEFIIAGSGLVVSSNYSSSPVGRMDPAETLTLLKFLSSKKSG